MSTESMDASKSCGYLGQACSSLVKLHLGAYMAGRQWGRGNLAIFFDLIFLHALILEETPCSALSKQVNREYGC